MIITIRSMPRKAAYLITFLFVTLALLVVSSSSIAYAAPVSIAVCGGTDNVGGQNVECTVTIVNNLNQATGLASSTVTLEECHGFANAAPTCTTTVSTNATDLVLAVDQCNGSGNGGGGTVNCVVDVTNNVVGVGTAEPATINQCNESGQDGGIEPTVVCDPIGVTTDATITQCNTSGQGGGDTERVQCTVDTASTQTSLIPVKITQCIGSGNGGGGYVTCSAALRSIITAAPIIDDADNDGIPDSDEADTDGDGIIDDNDSDADGDGIPNVDDSTPLIPNTPTDDSGDNGGNGTGDDSGTGTGENGGTPNKLAETGSEVTLPLTIAGSLLLVGSILFILNRRFPLANPKI